MLTFNLATKLAIGASVALPAATMCVCRNLELVASGRIARLTRDDKRRKMFFDLAMCFGLPALIMVLRELRTALPFATELMHRRLRCPGPPLRHLGVCRLPARNLLLGTGRVHHLVPASLVVRDDVDLRR